jgi:hypothetical protein
MNEPPPLPASTTPKTSALAIWSLVLGILSLTCFWLFSAIPAVICGHMAYGRIKRASGALEGSGLAIGGLVTGYLSIGLSLVMIPFLAAIAIPNFVKARNAALTQQCVANLMILDQYKQQWALENKKEDTAVPQEADLLNYLGGNFPACPAGGVYVLRAVDKKPTCSIAGHQLPAN